MGLSASKPATMAAKELVSQTVASSKVVVFSKTFCPYCTKAKNALQQYLKPEQITVLEVRLHATPDSSWWYLLFGQNLKMIDQRT
jgi:glutaredoxin 3